MGWWRRTAALLGSIRTRLAVFFFLITAIAVAVVYVYVTPSLQSRLQTQKLTDTERLAKSVDSQLQVEDLTRLATEELGAEDAKSNANNALKQLTSAKTPPSPAKLKAARKRQATASAQLTSTDTKATSKLSALARKTGAQTVTPLQVQASAHGSPQLRAALPSLGAVPSSVTAIGDAAYAAHAAVTQPIDSGNGLVAIPIAGKAKGSVGSVFVYSVNFVDVRADVRLIRQRILVAAGIALAVALLLGILVARALTVRVLRLERSAQRVAQGDLTAQFEVDSGDEIGQLAAALAHMQSQLQQLEQARRRFVATASHELRTPIFSLGGFLELIEDEDLDEETRRQFVGQVREQVERLGKLATGLLDLSRLEAGSIDLQPTPTDLGVLSRAVASEFVPALALHDSQLALELPEEPLRALVDPDRVAQLLRILIDNAITHTPPGTPVSVGVADGGGLVRLSVADDGPGIPGEIVGRIFEPFYSADGVRGAGLGLAIAKELAERLSGSLEVSSNAERTVFTLTLPGEER